MNNRLSLSAIGHATSLFLLITFVACVGFDFVFPDHAMYEAWQKFLPGFKWISWESFFIGGLESYSYGWYFALIWVPIYNYIIVRKTTDD